MILGYGSFLVVQIQTKNKKVCFRPTSQIDSKAKNENSRLLIGRPWAPQRASLACLNDLRKQVKLTIIVVFYNLDIRTVRMSVSITWTGNNPNVDVVRMDIGILRDFEDMGFKHPDLIEEDNEGENSRNRAESEDADDAEESLKPMTDKYTASFRNYYIRLRDAKRAYNFNTSGYKKTMYLYTRAVMVMEYDIQRRDFQISTATDHYWTLCRRIINSNRGSMNLYGKNVVHLAQEGNIFE